MDPGFSHGCISLIVLFFGTLDSIKFVLRPIHLVFAKKFVFGAEHNGYDWQLLNLDGGPFGYQLTLEHSVDSNASIVAERDRFGPRVAFLEEYVLKVCGYK